MMNNETCLDICRSSEENVQCVLKEIFLKSSFRPCCASFDKMHYEFLP